VDLENVDRRRVAVLAGLVLLGLFTIAVSRTAGFGLVDPTVAAYGALVAGAVIWTGILWVVISAG
jgi:protein-S-isoprenylcysteine O-methyltransferase Ste14